MAVVWLGALFKETTLCCSLLILLGEHWPLKKRILSFAERLRPLPSPRNFCCWPMVFRFSFSRQQFFQRLAAALQLSGDLNPPDTEPCHICQRRNVADHDGSAVAKRIGRCCSNFWPLYSSPAYFLFGRVIEYRLWYEILPLGWMMISEAIANRYQKIQGNKAGPGTLQPASIMDVRTRRVMKGGYWLMMGGLLFVLVGVLIIADLIPSKPAASKRSGAVSHAT